MPPLHLVGWLHRRGRIYLVENGPSLGGHSVSSLSWGWLVDMPSCISSMARGAEPAAGPILSPYRAVPSPYASETRAQSQRSLPVWGAEASCGGLRAGLLNPTQGRQRGSRCGQLDSRLGPLYKGWF